MFRKNLVLIFVMVSSGMTVRHAFAMDLEEAEAVFSQANTHYRERALEQAIAGYQELIQNNHESAEVYYNLGNAYLQDERLSESLWAYLSAQRLSPRPRMALS